MENSEACVELVNEIRKGNEYPETYSLMIQVYMDAIDEGETPKMALSLAKNEIDL